MQERYLFRGKRIDNGEWAQGFLSKGRYHGKGELVPCIDYEEMGVMLSSVIDPATIGQCTGLRDKNGTMIFEGDILNFAQWRFNEYTDFIVEWKNAVFRIVAIDSATAKIGFSESMNEGEIIGTIHDTESEATP